MQLYDALFALAGSPVSAINRALAITEIDGAGAGLDVMQEVAVDLRLAEYQPYWVARAELLAKTGAKRRSPPVVQIAIGLERSPRSEVEEVNHRYLVT